MTAAAAWGRGKYAPGAVVTRTALRICPLCEAGCGLEVGLSATDEVVRIRGDRHDVWSGGYLCPKGPALKHLHEDPDRLRVPVVRRDGRLVEVGWDEAFSEARRLLGGVVAAHGRDALAVYPVSVRTMPAPAGAVRLESTSAHQ